MFCKGKADGRADEERRAVFHSTITSVVPIYSLLSGKENARGAVDLNCLYCIVNVFIIQRFYCAGSFTGSCSFGDLLHLPLNSSCCSCEDEDLFNVSDVAACSVDLCAGPGGQMLSL